MCCLELRLIFVCVINDALHVRNLHCHSDDREQSAVLTLQTPGVSLPLLEEQRPPPQLLEEKSSYDAGPSQDKGHAAILGCHLAAMVRCSGGHRGTGWEPSPAVFHFVSESRIHTDLL